MMAVNAEKISKRKRDEERNAWEKRYRDEAVLQSGIVSEGNMIFNLKKYAQSRGYPYYLAQYQESRLHGNYPVGIKGVKSMERMVDRSVGMVHRELKSESIQDLLMQLKQKGIEPGYDDVHFYMVRAPNSSREGIQYQRLLAMMRKANGIKEKKYANKVITASRVIQEMYFSFADNILFEDNKDVKFNVKNGYDPQNIWIVSYDNNALNNADLARLIWDKTKGGWMFDKEWLKSCSFSVINYATNEKRNAEGLFVLIQNALDWNEWWNFVKDNQRLYFEEGLIEKEEMKERDSQDLGDYELYGPDRPEPQF